MAIDRQTFEALEHLFIFEPIAIDLYAEAARAVAYENSNDAS